jgi:hypothetical protein
VFGINAVHAFSGWVNTGGSSYTRARHWVGRASRENPRLWILRDILINDLGAGMACFFATLLAMAALRPVAVAVELVDKPGGRKTHHGEIPVVGGLAMFVGCVFLPSVVLITMWSWLCDTLSNPGRANSVLSHNYGGSTPPD